MNRLKVAMLVVILLSVGLFSLFGQKAVKTESTAAGEYGCLVVSQVQDHAPQYTWYEPSTDRKSPRPPFAAHAGQMAGYLEIKYNSNNNDYGFVNALTKKGWQLVDVEREAPRPIHPTKPDSSAWTPYYTRYHFTRPVE